MLCVPVRHLAIAEQISAIIDAEYSVSRAAHNLHLLADAECVQSVRDELYAIACRIKDDVERIRQWYDLDHLMEKERQMKEGRA